MNERDALLKGILEYPESDLPRLVFADWLEEHAEPPEPERAEFIRVQIEIEILLAKAPKYAHYELSNLGQTVRLKALKSRELSLLSNHGLNWVGIDFEKPIVHHTKFSPFLDVGNKHSRYLFIRGFIPEVHGPLIWLVDGICEKCGGTGGRINQRLFDPNSCDSCQSTGRSLGHLRGILRQHPVQFVDVTDKEPFHEVVDALYIWYEEEWFVNEVRGESCIPSELFALLEGYSLHSPGFRSYKTADAARKALSDAILKLNKS